jgi:hypothetical protein
MGNCRILHPGNAAGVKLSRCTDAAFAVIFFPRHWQSAQLNKPAFLDLACLQTSLYLFGDVSEDNNSMPGRLAYLIIDCKREASGRPFVGLDVPGVTSESSNELLLFGFLTF